MIYPKEDLFGHFFGKMKVETKKEKYIAHKFISLIVPQNYEEEINEYYSPSEFFISEISRSIQREVPEAQVKRAIVNSETITLEVTQDCNLRCRYCPFSGSHYESYRTHNPKRMDYTIYIKAIDFFVDHCLNSPYRLKREDISISFYGGEPLLEFDNIYRAVKYAKDLLAKNNRKYGLFLMITTNGVLLNLDRAEKLIEENFRIDISLDGPEEEHDRFRIKSNGYGSFSEVFFNINKIKEKFPEYFEKSIRFFLTIHPFHDLKKIEEFFLSNETLFNERNVRINPVSTVNIKKSSFKSWFGNSKRQKEQEESLDKGKWFYKKIITSAFERSEEMPTRILRKQNSFTGSCSPGTDKLYIDTAGNFHICEKMNPNFAIGNLDDGFDLKNIKNIADDWRKRVIRLKCWDCEMWWQCGYCFANCSRFDKFVLNKKKCENFLKSIRISLVDFLKSKEIEDETKNYDRYADINRYLELL